MSKNKNIFIPPISGSDPALKIKKPVWRSTVIILIILAAVLPSVYAAEPLWTYSSPGSSIGGVSVSPKGDLIAVGAGKVLFFSRDGTLLAQEPFGTDVRMTADGKYTASVYSSSIYYFKNPLPAGSPDQKKVTRQWTYDLSEQVYAFDMNRDGSLIVGQTLGKNLFVLNTKTRIARGNTKVPDSVIKISGGGIGGISAGKIHTYSSGGNLISTFNLNTNSAPGLLVLPSDSSAVFSDGHTIHWMNIYDGTERWKRQVNGSVTALSITPGGSLIVAGTDAGTVAGLDANGKFSWNYSSNPENRRGAWITCSAVSDTATTIAAGTTDGKVLILNSRGGLSGSYDAHENIRHIAVSADGSLIVATGEETVYAFSPSATSSPVSRTTVPKTTPTSLKPVTSVPGNRVTQNPVPEKTGTGNPEVSVSASRTVTSQPTPYSVIRTATPSPVPAIIPLSALLVVALPVLRRR